MWFLSKRHCRLGGRERERGEKPSNKSIHGGEKNRFIKDQPRRVKWKNCNAPLKVCGVANVNSTKENKTWKGRSGEGLRVLAIRGGEDRRRYKSRRKGSRRGGDEKDAKNAAGLGGTAG